VASGATVAAPGPARGGHPRLASLVTSLLVAAGFVPVWLATGVLLAISAIIAPETLSGDSFSSLILPFTAFLAVTALGEMLVVMTGGIDLSIPGVIVLTANLLVGFGSGSDENIWKAILVCLGCAGAIGLFNGLLVGIVRLNPLIVTLAVGQIVTGITVWYATTIANESAVPSGLSSWAIEDVAGVQWLFWVSIILSLLLALILRYTTVGRRFQIVGANPRAAWIAGIHVPWYVVGAYVSAALLYGGAGILLTAFIRSPSIDLGDPYLLGPIAAVVIGGASLRGGLASATSVWVAAFALTLLGQMLQVLGLSTAWQDIIYGCAIAAGMVISGDRIVGLLGNMLQRPSIRARLGVRDLEVAEEEVPERRGPLEEGAPSY
jgi:ribose transport system permease protein